MSVFESPPLAEGVVSSHHLRGGGAYRCLRFKLLLPGILGVGTETATLPSLLAPVSLPESERTGSQTPGDAWDLRWCQTLFFPRHTHL